MIEHDPTEKEIHVPENFDDPCPLGCDPTDLVALDAHDDQCTRCDRIGQALNP